MTLDFALAYTKWRALVRKLYPEMFYWLDAGMKVRWGKGYFDTGVVTDVTYFPTNGHYLIIVNRGSEYLTFNDPNKLEVLNAE